MANILIIGASRGLGAALSLGVPDVGDIVWAVSRRKPDYINRDDGILRHWIEADLAKSDAVEQIAEKIGDVPLDLLVYNAGSWETGPFERVSQHEIINIVTVNLTTLLLTSQRFIPNLAQAAAGKVILIGSTCGLENEGSASVAYAATKFGVRGVAHALRELLRPKGIAVTCISPGSMATDLSWDDGAEAALRKHHNSRIPVHDVVAIVRCIWRLSSAACAKEIDLPALADTDV
ncbi:MAG: SDR family NAD(P)-dependent oxidoreductase [Betaproteobacteria bacterium]|jgi:short-subunit dehydrogenase